MPKSELKQKLWEISQCLSHSDDICQTLVTLSFSFNGYSMCEKHIHSRARKKYGVYQNSPTHSWGLKGLYAQCQGAQVKGPTRNISSLDLVTRRI